MKKIIKRAAEILSFILVFPLFLMYQVFALSRSRIPAFQSFTQLLSLMPGKTGSYLRKAFLRMTLPRSSLNVEISFGVIFSHPEAQIQEGVYIGPYSSVGWALIRDDVLIAGRVSIISGRQQHSYDDLDYPVREQGGKYQQIEIGRDSWIGTGSIIAANVGEQCVVGAGSVVLKDIPPGSIVIGNPARIVGNRLEHPKQNAAE